MRYKLGFIGAGVMAGSILDNIVKFGKNIEASDIIVFDIDSTKTSYVGGFGVNIATTEKEVFDNSEIVLLGVKPQFYADILAKVGTFYNKNIVSIMAGVRIKTLRKYFDDNIGICRVMPNTPCKIGKGMVALTFDNIDENVKQFIIEIFDACGETIVLDENKFDAVTSISGSGPAYVYMVLDAFIKGGMNGGLSYNESKKLAIQTLIGASELAKNSNIDMDILCEKVCSKGGTTIEAVDYYRELNLEEIIIKGIDKCREKSKLLSDKL